MTIPTIDQLKRGIAIAEQIAALEKELAGILGNHPRVGSIIRKPSTPMRALAL